MIEHVEHKHDHVVKDRTKGHGTADGPYGAGLNTARRVLWALQGKGGCQQCPGNGLQEGSVVLALDTSHAVTTS